VGRPGERLVDRELGAAGRRQQEVQERVGAEGRERGEVAAPERRAYFEEAPTVESIYRASLYLLGVRVNGALLEPDQRPLFLSPVDDFRFPERRGDWKLAQPRPPGTDPIAWMVEAVEAMGEAAGPGTEQASKGAGR